MPECRTGEAAKVQAVWLAAAILAACRFVGALIKE